MHTRATEGRPRRARWLFPVLALLILIGLAPGVGAQEKPAPADETTWLAPDARIVGGTAASPGEYPYQVGLLFDKNAPFNSQFCGGSVIQPNWVLTAAHCVEGMSASDLWIFAGQNLLNQPAEIIAVSSIRIHPSWTPSTFQNDIALLRLTRAVNTSLVPIVRSSQTGLFPAGTPATVTGWGALSSGGPYPMELREVTVPIVSNATCGSASNYGADFKAGSMICAGQTGKDSCQGDSGGPLVVDGPGPKPIQMGIVSWGIGCAAPNKPGVYTRLSAYFNWIQDTIGRSPVDNFSSAGTSACAVGTDFRNNAFAIKETGEPNHAGDEGGASLWRRFTAPSNGTLRINTLGSDVDTLLAVYTGSAVNALTQRAANDDLGGSDVRSRVSLPVTAGTTYRIAADSYNTGDGGGPDRGRIRFNWSFEPASGAQFTDVPTSSDFYDDIEFVANAGITTGFGNCTYRPSDIVDRQSMAAFFYRLAGWELGYFPDGGFSDVKGSNNFYREINWLVDAGIATGYSNGAFRPSEAVTRQSMAAFFYRLAGSPRGADPSCVSPPFPDVPTSNPFCGEIDWLVDAGIAGGFGDGTYRPLNPVGRQAMARFMYNYVAAS